MPTESFFPFNQDHPKFPTELRILQNSFKARAARDKNIHIEQVDNVSYVSMFQNGCRKAFSGIFRGSSKDFCLIENMNPDLLTEFFFDIKHGSNSSQHADITPAVKGVRDMRKFFFISCDYLDPEHVLVRTYSKLKGFDWNDRAQINNLNLFRQAAITEACGVTAFDEDGAILKPGQVKPRVREGTDERNSKKRKATSIEGPTDDKLQKGSSILTQMRSQALTPNPVQSAAQTLPAQPTAQPFRFQPTARPFQPDPPSYGIVGMQAQPSPAPLAQPARNQEQRLQGLWRDPHTGWPVPSPGYMAPQLSQGDSHVVFPQHNQQPRMNQFQGQGFGMNQQGQREYNQFSSQEFGMPHQQVQESYGSSPQFNPTQNYVPSRNQGHGMDQQQYVQQGYNPSQNYGYVPQYLPAQGYVPLQPQGYGMHQQPAQQGLLQPQNPGYGMRQQVEQGYNQMQNQGFAVPQQQGQQSYNQSTFSHITQQASSQYNPGAIASTGRGRVTTQMTSSMNSNQNQLISSTAAGGGGVIAQSALNSISAQDLADAFTSTDMTFEAYLNIVNMIQALQ
ncbi:hypothetical protein EAF04_001774 [Stromatinia cepivora]|nr:hypothetical protein EAF04_001774 [Stromatinia cepivora]